MLCFIYVKKKGVCFSLQRGLYNNKQKVGYKQARYMNICKRRKKKKRMEREKGKERKFLLCHVG